MPNNSIVTKSLVSNYQIKAYFCLSFGVLGTALLKPAIGERSSSMDDMGKCRGVLFRCACVTGGDDFRGVLNTSFFLGVVTSTWFWVLESELPGMAWYASLSDIFESTLAFSSIASADVSFFSFSFDRLRNRFLGGFDAMGVRLGVVMGLGAISGMGVLWVGSRDVNTGLNSGKIKSGWINTGFATTVGLLVAF